MPKILKVALTIFVMTWSWIHQKSFTKTRQFSFVTAKKRWHAAQFWSSCQIFILMSKFKTKSVRQKLSVPAKCEIQKIKEKIVARKLSVKWRYIVQLDGDNMRVHKLFWIWCFEENETWTRIQLQQMQVTYSLLLIY